MANCEAARAFIQGKIDDAKVAQFVDQGMLEDAVKACCDDVTSAPCVSAVAKIVASAGCAAYTEGACVPCCSAAVKIIGPIIDVGATIFIGAIKGAWNFVSDLFGGGSCSYLDAGNRLTTQYSSATRSLVDQFEKAWKAGRESIGLPGEEVSPDGMFCNGSSQPGGVCNWSQMHEVWVLRRQADDISQAILDPILVEDLATVMQQTGRTPFTVTWEELLLSNAARMGLKIWPYFTWSIKGNSSAKVWMDMIDFGSMVPLAPEQYFRFQWSGFPCNESQNWQNFARDLMAKRQECLGVAAEELTRSMAASLTASLTAHQSGLVLDVARQIGRNAKRSGSKLGTAALVIGLTGAAAAGAYYLYWKPKREAPPARRRVRGSRAAV